VLRLGSERRNNVMPTTRASRGEIDLAHVVAEVRAACKAYQRAPAAGDVTLLDAMFSDDPRTICQRRLLSFALDAARADSLVNVDDRRLSKTRFVPIPACLRPCLPEPAVEEAGLVLNLSAT
jgi:hypothetical protein